MNDQDRYMLEKQVVEIKNSVKTFENNSTDLINEAYGVNSKLSDINSKVDKLADILNEILTELKRYKP